MRDLRGRLTYGNVTATMALFVALGGTGYAASKLPHHSVGSHQLKKSAVTSRAIENGTINLRDISSGTRDSLQGTAVFHASMNSAGQLVRGNAIEGGALLGDGQFSVRWKQDVSNCDAVATLASVTGGPVTDPPAGRITVKGASPGVDVYTYDASGVPIDLPFSVVAVC